MKISTIILLLSIFLLPGCQRSVEVNPTATPWLQVKPSATSLQSSPTSAATAIPLFTPSATPELPRICSPLVGYSFTDLEQAIVNPYQPPPPGSDLPHQGIDFAVMEQGTHIALAGSSVQAILSGVVRAIIVDRFPYGNAILVETRLQPEDDRRNILDPLPSPWADVEPDPALTCPASGDQQIEHERSSIYILYAHLLEAPTVAVDDAVDCGETIGKIGMSGNALNPHVHVETRLGPPSIHLESMAHYDSSATLLEMNAYCQWRVSGIFQHFDPMLLIRGLSSSTSP